MPTKDPPLRTKEEAIMASELERLAAIEATLGNVKDDVREIKDLVTKRDEICMAHIQALSNHGAQLLALEKEIRDFHDATEKEIDNCNSSVGSLRNKVWTALIGAFLALVGVLFDYLQKK